MQVAPPGAMLAVALSEAELAASLPSTLSLAAVNGPHACVVAGPAACVDIFGDRLTKEGVAIARLATSHAFHSAAMDSALPGFGAYLRTLKLAPPKIPFISNITGNWITADEATDPDYWVRQARQPVRFSDGLATLLAEDGMALLEVGPGQVLGGLTRTHPGQAASVPLAGTTSRRPGGDDASVCLDALGTLWAAGITLRWSAVIPGTSTARDVADVLLPASPLLDRSAFDQEGGIQGAGDGTAATRSRCDAQPGGVVSCDLMAPPASAAIHCTAVAPVGVR